MISSPYLRLLGKIPKRVKNIPVTREIDLSYAALKDSFYHVKNKQTRNLVSGKHVEAIFYLFTF